MPQEDTTLSVEAPPAAGGRATRESVPAATSPAPNRDSKSSGRRFSRKALLAINFGSVAAGLGAWTAFSAAGIVGLPGPVEVVVRGGELLTDGTLGEDTGASLARVLSGFLMGWYQVGRALIEPWVQFFRTIPPLALLPLVMVTMGIGETPKVFVIFLAAFLSCVISTYQGVVSVDKTLINAARVLGANSFTIFRRVVVPASSPFILVGMRIGLGAGWATVVAAELLAAPNGLGMRMQQAQQFYDMPTILVNVIVIGILGLLMDRLLLIIEAHLTRWQERR